MKKAITNPTVQAGEQGFYSKLESLLKTDQRFLDKEDELLKDAVIDAAYKSDLGLIGLLLDQADAKKKFFMEVKGHSVFDVNTFIAYIQDKHFLNDSFTRFKNKIGLTIGGRFLNERKEVSLAWPFKDCVLEGGMAREEKEREEIFFNEILAQDEIDKLFAPKVLTKWKRYTAKGEEAVKDLRRDAQGMIRENIILKGNNLLSLHSLKEQFRGKIKVIYIDPPYNPETQSNTFCYNNNFNNSSWLTFMKNRLEAAKSLLTKDGVLIVAIDANEFDYLGVLLRETFSDHETHCITIVHNPRGVQGANFSYTHEYAFFVIPKGVKSISDKKIENGDINWSNLRNWGSESLRTDAKNCFYSVIVENDNVVGFGEVMDSNEHPKSQTVKVGNHYHIYPIDIEGAERKWRYARQSVEEVKHLLRAKKTKTGYEIEIGKDFGAYRTVWVDKRYDANIYGTKLVKELVPGCKFDFPKSLHNVYDCLYAVIGNDKDAIVLDFFAGSGTTAHAVLNLNKEDGGNRKFILAEQMFYVEDVTVKRVHKVIEMLGKEDFVYCELMKYNETFLEDIEAAKDARSLMKVWAEMKKKSFFNFNVDLKSFEENLAEFEKLSLPEQKETLCSVLNKNQLYVNLSEIGDADFKVEKESIELNRQFYRS